MNSVLMIQMEPATYVVALVRELRLRWDAPVDLIVVQEALTQDWNLCREECAYEVLAPRLLVAVHEIWQRLSSGQYCVVHLDGWGHPVMLAALLLAKALSIPVVVDTDTPDSDLTPPWKRLLKLWLYPTLLRLPSAFLPFGSRQAKYLRNHGVEDGKIRITRMSADARDIAEFCDSFGVDQRVAFLTAHRIPLDSVRFLYVGRLEVYKGTKDLLEAFQRLTALRSDVHLIVVGDGALRPEVTSACTKGMATYLGRLRGEELWQAYSSSSVFVLPSHRDNWGMVIGEAMSARLPVIVSDQVGCIDDMVLPDTSGLVYPARSVQSLTDAMVQMAEDEPMRIQMGLQGRALAADLTVFNTAEIVSSIWRGVTAHA